MERATHGNQRSRKEKQRQHGNGFHASAVSLGGRGNATRVLSHRQIDAAVALGYLAIELQRLLA